MRMELQTFWIQTGWGRIESNTEETANGSDPDDPNSVKLSPTNIISNQQLAFEENQAIGSVIASLIAEDRDQTDSHIFP